MKRSKSSSTVLAQGLRAAAGVVLVSSMGVAAAQAPAPGLAVVARLGEAPVRQDEIERLLQALPEAERTAVKAQIDAAVREVTSRIVSSSYLDSVSQVLAGFPSDAELKAAYEQGKTDFNLPAAYRVAQIYLATPERDAAAVAKVRVAAAALARDARTGDFAALARALAGSAQRRARRRGRHPAARAHPARAARHDREAQGRRGQRAGPGRRGHAGICRPWQAFLAQLAPPAQLSIDAAALDAALKKTN